MLTKSISSLSFFKLFYRRVFVEVIVSFHDSFNCSISLNSLMALGNIEALFTDLILRSHHTFYETLVKHINLEGKILFFFIYKIRLIWLLFWSPWPLFMLVRLSLLFLSFFFFLAAYVNLNDPDPTRYYNDFIL